MPVKVEVKLLYRSVFFAGETVHCQVAFTCVDPIENHSSGSFEDDRVGPCSTSLIQEDVTVAWASAQIYCQCHINESRVNSVNNFKGQHHFPGNVVTSFVPTSGETGHCFLSTKPVILLCNQKLKKGQTKIVNFIEDLPLNAPPSYQGQAVRFSYKITIGIGTIKGPAKLIRLPIRVVGTEGLLIEKQGPTVTSSSRNPFLDDSEEEDSSLSDVVVDRLTFLTSQRSKNVYNISCSQGCAGKFTLSKSYYRIGEDLQGSFDFTGATVKCMKYKVSLQSEEEVMESFRKSGSKQKTLHTTYSRCEECCLNCRQTNFCLPIPITATPEFSSKLVSVRWRLHCEVVTSAQNQSNGAGEGKDGDKKNNLLENGLRKELQNFVVPKSVKVESMAWDIPIRILASNPNQISLSSSNQLSASIIL